MSQWSEELVNRFSSAMRERRKALKLSAQDVADRTAELGHPVNRSAIAAWENHGRGDRLMLGDAIVLAEALRIPLAALLYPHMPDGDVEVLPGLTTDSYRAMTALTNVDPATGEFDLIMYPEDSESLQRAIDAPQDDMPPVTERITSYDHGSHLVSESVQREELLHALKRTQEELEAATAAGDRAAVKAHTTAVKLIRSELSEITEHIRAAGGVVNDG